jgi:glycine/D-amino acid oxidase-like deaminating enzyme
MMEIKLSFGKNNNLFQTDHVIVCCAKQSAELFENYPVLKPIRGQVSWVENSKQPLALDQALAMVVIACNLMHHNYIRCIFLSKSRRYRCTN